MLQLEVQTAVRAVHLDHAIQATRQALTAGVSPDKLMTTVEKAIKEFKAEQCELPAVDSCGDDLPLLTELPPGCVTIADAAEMYDIPIGTLRTWVQRRKVAVRGRIKRGAGSPHSVVYASDVISYRDGPRDKTGPKNCE